MNLESGKPYSLVEIFSGQKRIVIPDLQRDYCWGTVNGLAENFTKSLIELFDEGDGHIQQCSLGLIYSYENPANLVNIADGQQRLTTIYLLLCILYSGLNQEQASSSVIKNFLALDSSKAIWEPRLRYEVRESTRYFLKDFLNKAVRNSSNLSKLPDEGWYREEYKNDPSVGSMIAAIEAMQNVMRDDSFEKAQFSQFLLGIAPELEEENFRSSQKPFDPLALARRLNGYSGLCFVYFDVKDREFGEQMYVIINTRGEPMEINEHIKPLLISKLGSVCGENEKSEQEVWAEKWEEWQDFFWKNKKDKEHSGDEGFNDFLKWYVETKTKADPADVYKYFVGKTAEESKIILNDLEEYFVQLKTLWDKFVNSAWADIFKQIKPDSPNLRDLSADSIDFVVVPLLAFMVENPNNKILQYNQLRLLRRNLFDQEWKRKEAVKWADILSKSDWFKDDEAWKDELEGDQKERVIDLENSPHFGGSLSLVPQFAEAMAWDWNDLGKQKQALTVVHFICIEQQLFDQGQGNLLRRALLTVGNYFPNHSTACKNNEWHKLIFHEKEEKRSVLIELLKWLHETASGEALGDMLEAKIKSSDITDWRKPFITDLEIFKHCKHQRIEVGTNRVRVTYNPSKFTGQSTWFISELRMELLQAIKKSRPEWRFFKVAGNKDVEFGNESFSNEYEQWISVAIPVFDGKAMISVNSDGSCVEVGLRKGATFEQKDEDLKGRLGTVGAFSSGWEVNNEWWYAVKIIRLEGSIKFIKNEAERLLIEVDAEVTKLEN